jgi:hypothetical protein
MPTNSRWREFKFSLRHTLAAIAPKIPLISILTAWNQIRHDLSEPSRKRKLQI